MKDIKESEKTKLIFNKIGTEKTSIDFTLKVMDRINTVKIPQKQEQLWVIKHYKIILLPVILLVSFLPSLIDIISKTKINLNIISIADIQNWIQNFAGNFNFHLHQSIVSIVISSLILLSIYFILNYIQTFNPSGHTKRN